MVSVLRFYPDQMDTKIKFPETLTQHEEAVTGVSWSGDLMVSCSSDQTVMVYRWRENKFYRVQLLKTAHDLCHFTGVSIQFIEKYGYQIFATNSKGFILTWSFTNNICLLKSTKKIHNGSIESFCVRYNG